MGLLHKNLVVTHFGHHVLGLLPGIHEDIDSLVQLVEEKLHVFFLTFEVFWFLVTEELVKRGLSVLVVSSLSGTGTRVLSRSRIILLLLQLVELLLPLVRVGVSLLHESQSSLLGSSFDVLSSLWEEVTQIKEQGLVDTHEDDAIELGILVRVFHLWLHGLENKITLEVVEDLVVSEVGECGKIENGFLLSQFVIFVVEHLDLARFDEVHLFDATLVADNGFTGLVNSAVKTDDEFVDESPLTLFEEMVEVSLEPLELSSLGNQLSLHLGCHLLIEGELFDDEVVIVEEGLVDVVFDVVVQIWLNMERLVRFLNLFDPHVEGVQLLVDEVFEVVGGVKD